MRVFEGLLHRDARIARGAADEAGKWLDQHPVDPQVVARAVLLDAGLHPLMSPARVGDAAAEQPFPPWQFEAIVRVGLAGVDGLVDALHVVVMTKRRNTRSTGRGRSITISPHDLTARIAAGTVSVLDVRPATEFAAGRIPGALNATPTEIERIVPTLDPTTEIIAD